jgi:hypothetical protein
MQNPQIRRSAGGGNCGFCIVGSKRFPAYFRLSRFAATTSIQPTIMKIAIRFTALALLTSFLAACMSPAQRMQTRQSTRVQERTESRMENRGW